MPPEGDGATRAVARRGLFEVYRRERRRAWIEALGGSMRPLVGPGDWLLVDFGRAPAGIGEMVLFAGEAGFVVHRIVGRTASGLVTKGDAGVHCDPSLSADAVLGVVRARRRGATGPARRFGCAGPSGWAIARLSLLVGEVRRRTG